MNVYLKAFRASSSPSRLLLLVVLVGVVDVAAAQQVTLKPLKSSGIYELGDKAGWAVSGTGRHTYSVKQNNAITLKSGELDLSTGSATIELTLDEPAMLYAEVKPANGSEGKPVVAAAAVAPTRLQPTAPRPADFDAFWESKVKSLQEVPPNPVLTPKDGGVDGVDYAILRMDNLGGRRVHGQLAKPKQPGKRPALLILQWASPPYPLEKVWVTSHAKNGWLTLNVEPHDVLPDQPRSYYDDLPKELKAYERLGQEDRDKSHFLFMYLGGYRAVDYLADHPDWDGKTLVVMGISMGGQQSLCVAGLHPKVTHVIVNVPAGCDLNGVLHGRQNGYPFFPADNAKVMQTALYFDAVNFAPRIKATSLVAMGFTDTITPPAGIWTMFNQIKGPKLAVPMVDSPHNHQATPEQQRPWTQRSAEWLDTLAQGGQVKLDDVAETTVPRASVPAPRTDATYPPAATDPRRRRAIRAWRRRR